MGSATAQGPDEIDSELTPRPKQSRQWFVFGGAQFGRGGELFQRSGTPYTIDFFGNEFSPDGSVGFFAGAQCADPQTGFDDLPKCEREPAIYRLGPDEMGDTTITRMPGVGSGPGFVGEVSWIDDERALAVGGTGAYPRREALAGAGGDLPYTAYDEQQGAGLARAWLFEGGSWRELKNLPDPPGGFDGSGGDEIPDEMRAMTALACAPQNLVSNQTQFKGSCLAGALRQLWWWNRPGAETEGFEPTPVTDVPNATTGLADFRFRVRDIEFPQDAAAGGSANAIAVTSGCCSALTDQTGGARLLSYAAFNNSWRSEGLTGLSPEDGGSAGPGALADSYYSVFHSPSPGVDGAISFRVSAIASPGGPEAGDLGSEPGSRFAVKRGSEIGATVPQPDPADQKLTSLRLLSADGNFAGPPVPGTDAVNGASGTDGLPDWLVGRLKTSALGVAYTTVPSLTPVPSPLSCPIGGLFENICQPVPSNLTDPPSSKRLVGIGTYTLNSIAFLPGSDGTTAWAAGDRGAIARLGGAGAIGVEAEPPAPQLGPRRPNGISDKSPFAPYRPGVATNVGHVPALSTQPLMKLPEPRFVPYGSADPTRDRDLPEEGITSIAVSRDGTEGWAVGSGPSTANSQGQYIAGRDGLALHRFDGSSWMRCNPGSGREGEGGDPRCAGLAFLANRTIAASGGGKTPAPVPLSAVARIPLENDHDPSNDDEFLAVGFAPPGDQSGGKANMVIYRNGRWSPDAPASREITTGNNAAPAQIVFSSPADGWLTTRNDAGSWFLYRYTDADWPNGHWYSCGATNSNTYNPEKCGDGISTLPLGSAAENLQVQIAGDSVFVAGARRVGSVRYPFVARKSLDGEEPWRMEHDPGCPPPSTPPNCSGGSAEDAGWVRSFSVSDAEGGELRGWLHGVFGRSVTTLGVDVDAASSLTGPLGNLIAREPGSGQWTLRTASDAASDFLPATAVNEGPQMLSFRGSGGEDHSAIIQGRFGVEPKAPPLIYDAERDRWQITPAPWVSSPKIFTGHTQGVITAAAPDNRGGFWAAVKQGLSLSPARRPGAPPPHQTTWYYRYTDQMPQPVFTEAPHPIRRPVTGMTSTPAGELWLSTDSDHLYHYDRITGWEELQMKGWNAGRVVTDPAGALAIAVNADGVGVAIGEDGRIADLASGGVRLDPASGRRCSDAPAPCGTPRDLVAAAVAPDGSAIAGGDRLALLWRPAGGEFRLIDRPPISAHTTISALSMPVPGRAWLTTDSGQIWAGSLAGAEWRWELESPASEAASESGHSYLRAITIDDEGRGLAVGDRGALLERDARGAWRRLSTGWLEDLVSIALPPSGFGDGILIGGQAGLILTRTDGRYQVARNSDIFDPITNGIGAALSGEIVGVALAGGVADGDVEAWAVSQLPPDTDFRRDPAPTALLHYSSSDDPLLRPGSRSEPLPDAPAADERELSLAAFGHSECNLDRFCPESGGTNLVNEVTAKRIREEISRRAGEPGDLIALFTGDINAGPGRDQRWERSLVFVGRPNTPLDQNVVQNSWRELVAEPLLREQIPLFGALGSLDLSRPKGCVNAINCADPQEATPSGSSLPWRESLATMPEPWGDMENGRQPPQAGSLTLRAVPSSGQRAPGGGANTHYAIDIERAGDALARLIVLDSSAGSLVASDPNQNPTDEQQAWLQSMLETRPRGARAIVMSTTPTYSYSDGVSPAETASDAAATEAILLSHGVDAVISGRLGWNGLYYACAPGLHYPAPGKGYPTEAPEGLAECAAAASGTTGIDPGAADDLLVGTPTGALPFIVAAGGGGKFNPGASRAGRTTASGGFWRGYSMAHLDPGSGAVRVEQRPVFDWVGLGSDSPQRHLIRPKKTLQLLGYGREAAGIDVPLRYDEITSPAITHRYELIAADPDQPWLPLKDEDAGAGDPAENELQRSRDLDGENPCGPYVCLDREIGTVDSQSGQVRAGDGGQTRTFAIAQLSVGAKSATYPLVFEPRASYRSSVQAPPRPIQPPPPPQGPPVPPDPYAPVIVDLPTPPAIPSLPPQGSVDPPIPPSPESPPAQTPVGLTISPNSIEVAPPTAVVQPPAPPINPAPPSGARREARQRQAAAQKSGADAGESKETEEPNERVQMMDTPDQASTRLEPERRRYSFQPSGEQRSDWIRNALLGGGLGVAALLFSIAAHVGRPWAGRGPKPAPAFNHRRR